MKKFSIILAALAIAGFGYYTYLNHRPVTVTGAYHNKYTAEILVDHLPVSDSASIYWWQKNQSSIREKYHIPTAEAGPLFITIYAFGDGYKEEGKEDRLCFDDIKPPKNCIDKNILMSVNRTRDGDTTFSFKHTSYLQKKDDRLIKSE